MRFIHWVVASFIWLSGTSVHAALNESELQVESKYGKHLGSEAGACGADIYRTYKYDGLNITVLYRGGKSHGERYAKADGGKLSDSEITTLLGQNARQGSWAAATTVPLGLDQREWMLKDDDRHLAKAYFTPSGELLVVADQSEGGGYRGGRRPLLEELIKADMIVCVAAGDLKVSDDVQFHGLAPATIPVIVKNPIAIRGQPGNPLCFDGEFLLPKAGYYLVFVKKDEKALYKLRGTIIGFDQPLPDFDSKFDKAADAYELIKEMFFAEHSVGCSLGEAILLADAPAPLLKSVSGQIVAYSHADGNPMRVIAALYLLLKADGFAALQEIKVPDCEKVLAPKDGIAPFGNDTDTAQSISWQIVGWMRDRASEETYPQLAQFAESQSGEARSDVLIAMRPYASMFNCKGIVPMLEDPDRNVRYAVMSNLSMAFGESITGNDRVTRKMMEYWRRRIAEDPAR